MGNPGPTGPNLVADGDFTGASLSVWDNQVLSASSWTEVTMTMTEGAGRTTAEVFCWQAVAGTGYCSNVSLRAMN